MVMKGGGGGLRLELMEGGGGVKRMGKELFSGVLSSVRLALISRMAKPEEVIIVEDDNGDIVREETKDTDAIVLYHDMRKTLIYLTHLDPNDTQNLMIEKLYKQCNGSEWSWNNLNTLCWAIGSISGALGLFFLFLFSFPFKTFFFVWKLKNKNQRRSFWCW